MDKKKSDSLVETAQILLEDSHLVYEASWELRELFPGQDGETVAFLVVCARSLASELTPQTLANIADLTSVPVCRVTQILREILYIHDECPVGDLLDDLVLVSYILPTIHEIEGPTDS